MGSLSAFPESTFSDSMPMLFPAFLPPTIHQPIPNHKPDPPQHQQHQQHQHQHAEQPQRPRPSSRHPHSSPLRKRSSTSTNNNSNTNTTTNHTTTNSVQILPPITQTTTAQNTSVTTTLNRLVQLAEGRQKIAMLVQYVAKLAQHNVVVQHVAQTVPQLENLPESLNRLSASMSEARKGLRYFKLIEEWEKLRWIAVLEQHRVIRALATYSRLCSMWYLLCDHFLWIVQLRFVQLDNHSFRTLKRLKDTFSVLRYISELPVQTAKTFRLELALSQLSLFDHLVSHGVPHTLVVKYVEILCNLALAVNGLVGRRRQLSATVTAMLGVVAAFIALRRMWRAVVAQQQHANGRHMQADLWFLVQSR